MVRANLLTYDEVAARLAVGRRKVRELCQLGELDVVRLGHRTVRITEESVDSFIARKLMEKRRYYRG